MSSACICNICHKLLVKIVDVLSFKLVCASSLFATLPTCFVLIRRSTMDMESVGPDASYHQHVHFLLLMFSRNTFVNSLRVWSASIVERRQPTPTSCKLLHAVRLMCCFFIFQACGIVFIFLRFRFDLVCCLTINRLQVTILSMLINHPSHTKC